MKVAGIMLLLVGTVAVASASAVPAVPEIDASSAVGVLALVSGSLLILKSRRKK